MICLSNLELVSVIVAMFRDLLTFMLPVIGVTAGISFVMQALYTVTIGALTKAGRSI